MSPRRHEALAVLVLLATTLFVCRPWSYDPRFAILLEDTAWTIVTLQHLQDAAMGLVSWRDAPFAWPIPDAIAQADWVLGQALLGLPFRALGVDPFVAHGYVVLIGLFATAWACHRVAVALLGHGPHTWVAGIAGGLGPAQLAHVQHVNLVHHETTVLAALLLGVAFAKDRYGPALLAGLIGGLSFHFGFYTGVQTGLVLAIVAIVGGVATRPSVRTWGAFVGASALAVATVLPIVLVYRAFAEQHALRFEANYLAGESWDLAATLRPGEALLHRPLHAIWPTLPHPGMNFDPPNPGYAIALLALLGLAFVLLRERRWPWIAVLGVASASLLLALGPELIWKGDPTGIPGPYALLLDLPGFASLRGPARWFAIAFPAIGLLAAAGVRLLLDRVPSRFAAPAVLAVLALTIAELPPTHAPPLRDLDAPPVYARLSDAPDGALYDEIAVANRAQCRCRRSTALRALLTHKRPLVGGIYARSFADLGAVNHKAAAWPSARAAAFFADNGVTAVIEHPPLAAEPAGHRCETVYDHRICVLGADAISSP